MEFGDKIRKYRKELGETQTQFGEAVGLTKRTIINYEKHASKPKDVETYRRIAEHCGVDWDSLLTEEDLFMYKVRAQCSYKLDEDRRTAYLGMVEIMRSDEVSLEEKEEMLRSLEEALEMWKNQ